MNKNRLLFAGGFFLFLLFLVFRIGFLSFEESRQTLAHYAGQTVTIVGAVANDPERRDASLHVHIAVSTIDEKEANGKLLAQLPRDTEVFYGDRVTVRGKIFLPEVFETDTGRTFDYGSYLRVRGISALMHSATLEKAEPGGMTVQKLLYSLKHVFERSLERLMGEPSGSLMEGILLGERRALPPDLTQIFITTGLIHIVVLSGYNMGVVAEWTLRFFTLFLPRAAALWSGGVAIILFALMTGGGATTVRACVMGLIAILARFLHRPAVALRALGVAVALMVLWNPLVLLYDSSFILSVVATFGLITFSPAIEKKLSSITSRWGLRSIAASTIAVQLYILPALLYFTGVFSFVSLPANLLTLPLIPFAMATGFFAGILGLLHPLLGLVPALLSDILLRFVILIASTLAAFPLSATIIAEFPLWIALGIYLPLTAFSILLYRKSVAHKPSSCSF